jgi:acetyl/propionyl-CoA carboxylase alpha subunit
MGSKIGAKELMRKADVPTLEAPETPNEADLPLLVKASAGGGGRGMRIVRALADLESVLLGDILAEVRGEDESSGRGEQVVLARRGSHGATPTPAGQTGLSLALE